ncbi:MAG: hypothetical protein R2862_12850 [Thermoanaerobaculia bacterium]
MRIESEPRHTAGDFEPLIDEDTFGRAQLHLSDTRAPITAAYRRNHPDFPLRRFVRYPASAAGADRRLVARKDLELPLLQLRWLQGPQRPQGGESAFERLGMPAEDEKRLVFPGGHSVPRTETMRESLAWLDRYLGPGEPH